MFGDDDYWDSGGYNDFWRGAPGLPPHIKTRPDYGPLQVRSPEELEIGKRYILHYFGGIKIFVYVILIASKNSKSFSYEVISPKEDVSNRTSKMSFADSSILPYGGENKDLWNNVNYILRTTD